MVHLCPERMMFLVGWADEFQPDTLFPCRSSTLGKQVSFLQWEATRVKGCEVTGKACVYTYICEGPLHVYQPPGGRWEQNPGFCPTPAAALPRPHLWCNLRLASLRCILNTLVYLPLSGFLCFIHKCLHYLYLLFPKICRIILCVCLPKVSEKQTHVDMVRG